GLTIVACVNAANGYVYISNNTGASWREVDPAGKGPQAWNSVTITKDGQVITASATDGYVYLSTDGGDSWVQKTFGSPRTWYSINILESGNKLIGIRPDGQYVYEIEPPQYDYAITS